MEKIDWKLKNVTALYLVSPNASTFIWFIDFETSNLPENGRTIHNLLKAEKRIILIKTVK